MGKKKFFDTTVGKILKSAATIVAPGLVSSLENVGSVGEAVSLINGSGLTAEEKQLLLNTLITANQSDENELTIRHQNDAMSDSWLSKNVRPLVLIWCIVIFSAFGILDAVDSVGFTISPEWIDTFKAVMQGVVGFYFTGRTIEKGINAYKALKR